MNLVDALGGGEVEHAVCTTYPFEPLFFSNFAIDSLQDVGVATPVVLMDSGRYEDLAQNQRLTSRAIGQHYYLEPVTVDETFHPKVAFLGGESACHVCVSSANLTLGEYTTAAQLGQELTVSADDAESPSAETSKAIEVAQDVRAFVDQLAGEYVSGRDPRTEIRRAVQATEWLDERTPSRTTPGGFVHNLETPILTQVTDQIGEITTATLFAPFFGSETTLAELDAQLDADQYEILVAEGNTHLDPESAVRGLGDTVTFRPITHDTGRWIHAKGIVLKGRWGTATLYGSPNITGQALLETAESGNLEAGLLHYDEDGTASNLWRQESFPARIGPDRDHTSFDFADYSTASTSGSTPSLTLSDARVEEFNDEEIVISLVSPDIEDGTTVTIETLNEQTTGVVWETDGEAETEALSVRLPESYIGAIICLQVPESGRSNYRQITTEPTKGTRDLSDVIRNGGREGIQSLVDETLFLGADLAPGVISDAVSRLSVTDRDQAEQNDTASDTDEDDGPGLPPGITGVSNTTRKPHLGVKDGMDFAENSIESILSSPPTVASVEELLDHFENLWYYITRGLIRSALSPQLEASTDDEPEFETTLNVERLHSICGQRINSVFESRLFVRSRTHINAINTIEPDLTAEALSEEQLLDVYVSYPAIVLALFDWHNESFFERFEFIRQYHEALRVADPIIGESLIDGKRVQTRLSEHEETIEHNLAALGDRFGSDLVLPGDFEPGLELLFYGFWYRELAQDSGKELFDNKEIYTQYDPDGLAEMARIALRGAERVEEDARYNGLSKGLFDPVVRLTEGLSDPAQQLQDIVDQASPT